MKYGVLYEQITEATKKNNEREYSLIYFDDEKEAWNAKYLIEYYKVPLFLLSSYLNNYSVLKISKHLIHEKKHITDYQIYHCINENKTVFRPFLLKQEIISVLNSDQPISVLN